MNESRGGTGFMNKETARKLIALTLVNNTSQSQTVNLFQTSGNFVTGAQANVVTGNISVGTGPVNIAYDSLDNRMYVANQVDNTVSVINCTTNLVVGSPIAVGSSPVAIAYDSLDNRMYVTNQTDDTVSVINCTTNLVVATISVGTTPFSIAYDSLDNRMYVGNQYDNTISVINCTTNLVVGSPIAVGSSPVAIAYDSLDNRMYVTNQTDDTVSVINCTTNLVVATISVGTISAPSGVSYNSSNKKIYVTDPNINNVSVITTVADNISATTNGLTYTQILQELSGNPILLLGQDLFVLTGNYNQVLQAFAFVLENPDATNETSYVYPVVQQGSYQPTKQNLDIPKDFILDGQNYVQYTLLANQTVLIFFRYNQAEIQQGGMIPPPQPSALKQDTGKKLKFMGVIDSRWRIHFTPLEKLIS